MLKSKPKLFIDFDSTIANSVKAYCNAYNKMFRHFPNFVPADWTESYAWDLKDVAPMVDDVNFIFGHSEFFDCCEFYDDDTYKVLKELSEYYEIIVASIGIPNNLAYKAWWLETNLPFVKEYVLLCNKGCKMNKSVINMQGAIFIDDVVSNLESSNARMKICFGVERDWNKGWADYWCKSWSEVRDLLIIGS